MKKHILSATKRTVTGRKVKQLRREGQLPATVYGKKVKSESLTVPADAFTNVYKDAGETGLVELTIGSDVKPVLIHTVQIDPVTSHILHVEFFQVDLKEKVKTRVPLVFTGESAAVANKVGALLTVLDELEIEALPTELPEGIEVDITSLAEVGQEFKVSDIAAPAGVTVLTDAGLTVVKVSALVSKEAEAQAAEEAAVAAAAAPAEGAEPEAAAEGEEKKEPADAKAMAGKEAPGKAETTPAEEKKEAT